MHHVSSAAGGVIACAAARHASFKNLHIHCIQTILYTVYYYILLVISGKTQCIWFNVKLFH